MDTKLVYFLILVHISCGYLHAQMFILQLDTMMLFNYIDNIKLFLNERLNHNRIK